MNVVSGLNSRITQLAVGRHLPYRTIRARLTLIYGGLFLLSGAALMAISYLLLVNAGFVFTLQNGTTNPPRVANRTTQPNAGPLPAQPTHPSAQTMAHWRAVAQCMRRHGVSHFPDPTTSAPTTVGAFALTDRDGAIFAIPATLDMQSTAVQQTGVSCGFFDAYQGQLIAQNSSLRAHTRQELLIQSAIALAGMSLLSLGLGWLMAGRVLQPLEDSYQAQRQFVANASHELRAPLTRLRALTEFALTSSEGSAASLRKAHERVLASEQHLEQLIDALLALSRGQAGLERHEPVDLALLTSRAISAHKPAIAELELDLRTTLDTATTNGDPRLVERLINNLIENATRHNTPRGQIEIATATQDRHPRLTITNTGPTVPPEEVDRLFQPFQRLRGTRTHHDDGHGLGLSIVQAVATAHRAVLTASPRPSGGLTIEISFPPTTGTRPTFSPAQAKTGSPAIPETDAPRTG